MIQLMWPGGQQPRTASPKVMRHFENGAQYVSLNSATEGASIGYRFLSDQQDAGWQLYGQPVQLPPAARLEAKAIRYGFAESSVTVIDNLPGS